ncbi:MAG: integration host factor subunit beta [Pseudomonadota bacterium]|nr:integration host factor subunit beta [Pseudomonadota bacterium]MEC7734530.1 integration host factor subunit beta [Pseudomonadota bacterium]MEC9392830.1 integration host factor subunit beta [Pseudomonadota bacterium]MEC9459433.1 integration host factor subunit beta [Pseudomonadota bacterium]MEC9481160.1 integration host factor subunit beta [Pseudomonadota bacterium]
MIKSQLIKRLLNKNPHLIQKDVEKITSLILETVTSTLADEGRIEIRGFGSLSVRKRNAKNGRNPKTGESVFVPAKKVPIFKSGKGLRDRLNYKS